MASQIIIGCKPQHAIGLSERLGWIMFTTMVGQRPVCRVITTSCHRVHIMDTCTVQLVSKLQVWA